MTDYKDKYIELLEKHNEALQELAKTNERLFLIVFMMKRLDMPYKKWIELIEITREDIFKKLCLPVSEYKIIIMEGETSSVQVFNLSNHNNEVNKETLEKIEKVLNE